MTTSRRRFLQFLASSPLLAHVRLLDAWMQDENLIAAAKEALDVFDFEPVARRKLPPAHWGYLATGTDDDGTIQANRDGFNHYAIRMRRLVDISRIDMSVKLLGTTWDSPILLCPVGHQKAFHPEGEIAVARAAKTKNHLQVLSTVTTSSVEDVIAARGATAVVIGRPQIWGLASFGQEGVETVLSLLRRELAMGMRQAGTTSVSEITKSYV